jgi:hypothetical protein
VTCSGETYSALQFAERANRAVIDFSPAKSRSSASNDYKFELQQERNRVVELKGKI